MEKNNVTTLNEILATRARIRFPHRVNFETVPLVNIDQMKSWCEKNCTGIWRSEHYHALYFQFENDYDATMFVLRWGGAKGNRLK